MVSSKWAHSHEFKLQPYSSLMKPTSYPIFLFYLKKVYLSWLKTESLSHYRFSVANYFKHSCYNQRVGTLAPACIVSVDFVQSINSFREVKEYNPQNFQINFQWYKQTEEKKSTLRCAPFLLFSHGEKTRHHAKRSIARWISSLGSVYMIFAIFLKMAIPIMTIFAKIFKNQI